MQNKHKPTHDNATTETKPDALSDEQLKHVAGGTNSPPALKKQPKPGGSIRGFDAEFGIEGHDW